MEQFSVRPNAADVERPYIERNIAATRQAYRIDSDDGSTTGTIRGWAPSLPATFRRT